MRWRRREQAALVRQGAALLDSDLDAARRCYLQALEMDPSISEAWFDLGLIAKWRREWADCITFNRRAASLATSPTLEENPACWNAGIAATAIRDWETARWAWSSYGVNLPDGDGEIDGDFGPGVVRLPEGETVWGHRLDPARMVLLSVPFPESGFRSGDIVLHDGAPVGSRVAGGREFPVFDVIERWEASPVPTISVDVDASDEALAVLLELAVDAELMIENWTTSVVIHCKACSMGRVDYDNHDHDHQPRSDADLPTRLGMSGPEDAVRAMLQSWASDTGSHVLDVVVHD